MIQKQVLKDRHIRIQTISETNLKNIINNVDELIHNDLKANILHVGTNNMVEDTPGDIYIHLISLKTNIEDEIPKY